MSDVFPIPETRFHAGRPRCRVTVRHGAHRWSFSFAPDDAPVVLRRVEELEQDPDAPLARPVARLICREIHHARTAHGRAAGLS